jgi:hypothetical protein
MYMRGERVTILPVPDPFEVEASYVVEAQVEHHPPCVPECPVCYPEDDD